MDTTGAMKLKSGCDVGDAIASSVSLSALMVELAAEFLENSNGRAPKATNSSDAVIENFKLSLTVSERMELDKKENQNVLRYIKGRLSAVGTLYHLSSEGDRNFADVLGTGYYFTQLPESGTCAVIATAGHVVAGITNYAELLFMLGPINLGKCCRAFYAKEDNDVALLFFPIDDTSGELPQPWFHMGVTSDVCSAAWKDDTFLRVAVHADVFAWNPTVAICKLTNATLGPGTSGSLIVGHTSAGSGAIGMIVGGGDEKIVALPFSAVMEFCLRFQFYTSKNTLPPSILPALPQGTKPWNADMARRREIPDEAAAQLIDCLCSDIVKRYLTPLTTNDSPWIPGSVIPHMPSSQAEMLGRICRAFLTAGCSCVFFVGSRVTGVSWVNKVSESRPHRHLVDNSDFDFGIVWPGLFSGLPPKEFVFNERKKTWEWRRLDRPLTPYQLFMFLPKWERTVLWDHGYYFTDFPGGIEINFKFVFEAPKKFTSDMILVTLTPDGDFLSTRTYPSLGITPSLREEVLAAYELERARRARK